jgi:UDPglucose 6-dehydrogenase
LDGLEIGVLGLSFKPNTDDMREAPSVELIHLLQSEGAKVSAFDPAAMPVAAKLMENVKLCANPYQVAEGSDALIVVTEWNEFKQLNKQRLKSLMRQHVLIDGRNIYDPHEMEELGFVYYGIGRGKTPASTSVLDRDELNTAGIPNVGSAG